MNKMYQINEEHLKYYEFLEALRKSGETNMYGASPYLAQYFRLENRHADSILAEWMNNYDEINERWNIRERIKPLKIRRTTKIIFED